MVIFQVSKRIVKNTSGRRIKIIISYVKISLILLSPFSSICGSAKFVPSFQRAVVESSISKENYENKIINCCNNTIEENKLKESVILKAGNKSSSYPSINKLAKKLINMIENAVNKDIIKILSVLERPAISSPDLSLTPVKHSNLFVDGFLLPEKTSRNYTHTLFRNQFRSAQQNRRMQLLQAYNNLQNNDPQFIKERTKLRRATPLYPSRALGDSYKYGSEQLKIKGPRHLKDFNISVEGKTETEIAMEYIDFLEGLLSKKNLIVHKNGTLNKQEATINIGDPESLGIIAFENNPLYENHHFISGYPISEKAFEIFNKTGNIGVSPEERKLNLDVFQKKRAQKETDKTITKLFYTNLPENARIGNQQLREVESLQKKLDEDPCISLSEKEKSLLQRADRYKQYKSEFYQDNPGIDKNKF